MNRIQKTFDDLRAAGKKALIPYITPEFPLKDITLPLLNQLAHAGADLIEVGVPFSDPLADGRTIQHSSEVALRNGATISRILDCVRRFRAKADVPLLLMAYVNSILRYGVERFAASCADAGVDGLIVPDLPPEEAGNLKEACTGFEISNVFLIAPTTSEDRIRLIDGHSTHFSYCVSVTGVTGARSELGGDGALDEFLQRVRRVVRKPFVVGFGISRAEHVSRVWRHADGAVVGSALIDLLGRSQNEAEALAAAREFLLSLRAS